MKTTFYAFCITLATTLLCIQCDPAQQDACAETMCQNGGTCNEGNCECPEGFGGADCNEHPKYITIYKVEIVEYPTTDFNGVPWDAEQGIGRYPDLYFDLRSGMGISDGYSIINSSSQHANNNDGAIVAFQDAATGFPNRIDFWNNNSAQSNYSMNHRFILYDLDSGSDDVMVFQDFNWAALYAAYSDTTTIVIERSTALGGHPLKIILSAEWGF